MIRARALAAIGIIFAGGSLLLAVAHPAKYFTSAPAAAHHATLDQYCFRCHSSTTPRAGVNLRLLDFANLEDNGAIWEKLLRKLRNREMPPAGMPRPDAATYEALVKYIETERDRLAEVKPNPGRPTLHRLNRTEYANAIRDLLAIEIDVAELLPADDIGYGFDNIGDVLNVSPVLLERYLSAAGKISRLAVGDTTLPASYQTYDVPHGLKQGDRMSEDMPLGSRGGTVRSATASRWTANMRFRWACKRGRFDEFLGLERERKLDLRLDGQRLELFTIAADPRAGELITAPGSDPDAHLKVRVPVKAGTRTLVATFLKDTRDAGRHSAEKPRDGLLRRRRQHLGCRPVQCARAGRNAEPRAGFSSAIRPRAPRSRLAPKRSSPTSRTAPIGGRSRRTICRNCSRSTGKAPRAAASRRACDWRCRRSWCRPNSSSAWSSIRRTRRPAASTGSATSSLHRACRSSCGAAFPTTNCSRLPSAAS